MHCARKSKRRPYLGLYVKLYITSLDDIKIRQLDAASRCFWMDALMLAKPNHGVLPPVNEMAFRLRMQDGEVRSRIMALVALGLIDEDHASGSVVWSVHAWDTWQSDSLSTPRVRRYRRKQVDETHVKHQRNVSCNANETVRETHETNSYSNSTYSTVGKSRLPRTQHCLPGSEIGSAVSASRVGGQ